MKVSDEVYQFITKVIAPATIGISFKVAVQMKREKVSYISVILSYVIGIAVAVISAPFINQNVPNPYRSMTLAIIAISGEKVGDWLIYQMEIDKFLGAILNAVRDVIINIIKK
jgi:hypothetical protein